jgi:hypothetical protein
VPPCTGKFAPKIAMTPLESQIEATLIEKLRGLKYEDRGDILDRAALEKNFREKFEALNRVRLTEGEFQRLLEEIITPDVFAAARLLRTINDFARDDGTPLNYTLVNIKDWCKNTFEVVNQLRINTDNSHQRFDVILLINGVPVVQIELKSLGISPRRAMEQIVEYKNDPGNGYTRTLLCFMQVFIVSNRSDTWYFANNNNMMRMWQGALGVAFEDCMVSPAHVILSPRNGVCSDFYSYLLKLPKYLRILTANSQGLTKDRLRLYYKDFAQIHLHFPKISEQKKIADFLSSSDKLIAAQARKLAVLKTHKQGLMQQLFPSPEEVEP